jgi:GGDEF domain-containing protein
VIIALFGLLIGTVFWSRANAATIAPSHELLASPAKRELQQARRMVLYDENLGLYQRWYLELRLAEEMARCKRYGLSMALIVVSLVRTSLVYMSGDGWKDDASQAAYTTARSVRTVDLTAALGPGEFAVCLVHCDKDGAEIAKKRLENTLKLYGPSIGLVVFPLEKVEPKRMIQLAQSRASLKSERDIA